MTDQYSNVAEVKEILRINEGDVSHDTEIEGCITSADRWIIGVLTRKGISIPSTAPDNLNEASKNFASWQFRLRAATSQKDVDVAKAKYLDPAITALESYIKQEGQISFVVGETDQS